MSAAPQVFISHAGEDKQSIAIPLHLSLTRLSIPSFVDKLSLEYGRDAPDQIIRHMENAPVAVFILTHHFVAKKWPMEELFCFLRRLDVAKRQKAQPPLLIPVFYGMSVDQCNSNDLFKARDTDGDNIFEKLGFNDRCELGQTSRQKVRHAISTLSKCTGIENDECASNLDNEAMRQARSRLVTRIATLVGDAVARYSAANPSPAVHSPPPHPPADRFSPQYHVPLLSPHHIFDFETRNHRAEFCTAEARLKARLMSTLSHPGNQSTTALGRAPRAPGALGMGGVGKSTAIIGIAWEPDVRKAFPDGIYLISAGADADESHMLLEISKVVDACGGNELAARVRAAPDLKHGVLRASPWFDGKKILLLLDDLWETKWSALGFFDEIRGLVSPAGRILVTTRSKTIAQAAGCQVYFDTFDPLSQESRRILLHYADLEGDTLTPSQIDDNTTLEKILKRCAGLPLALGIAGRAIQEIRDRDCETWDNAIRTFCDDMDKENGLLMLGPSGVYEGLGNTVHVSLVTADRWFEREGPSDSSPSILPPSKLYERLGVLRKQSSISAEILSRLWGTRNKTQAMLIANKLSTLSLLSNEHGIYKIHDLLMDVCVLRANTHGGLQSYHDSLLRTFPCPIADGTKRAWWDRNVDSGGYLSENLARHLIGSGNQEELYELLIDARWTLYRVKRGNYLAWLNDLTELYSWIDRAEQEDDDGCDGEMQRCKRRMKLLEHAISLLWQRLTENPSELAFQLIAHFGSRCRGNDEVGDFVKSAIQCAERPWLRPEQPFLSARGTAATLIMQFEVPVQAVVVDQVGHWAYVGLQGGMAAFDSHSRQVIKIAGQARFWDQTLAISGDGRCILSMVHNHEAHIWEREGGLLRHVSKMDKRYADISCAAISRSGKRIVLGLYDKKEKSIVVTVLDAENFKVGEPLKGHQGRVMCLAISEDGKWAVSGSLDNSLRVWDTERMIQTGYLSGDEVGKIECVDISSDGKIVVSGSSDGMVQMWNTEGMHLIGAPFVGHSDRALCVALSHDGRMIVSGSADRTLRVWDVRQRCGVGRALEGHSDWVTSVAISQDGSKIVSGSVFDRTMRVWDSERIWRESAEASHEALLRNGEDVESREWKQKELVTSEACGESRVPCRPYDWSQNIKVSKDGRKIAFVSSDGSLCIWDVERMCDMSGRLEVGDELRCVDMTDDGKWIVTGEPDGRVWLWNVAEGSRWVVWGPVRADKAWRSRPNTDILGVNRVVISSDGTQVLSAHIDNSVRVWDVERSFPRLTVSNNDDHNLHLRISEDGSKVVMCSRDGVISGRDICGLWDETVASPYLEDVRILENNLVLLLSRGKSELLRFDEEVGFVPVDMAEPDNEDAAIINSVKRPVLQCIRKEVWMVFPRRKLLGTLEAPVGAFAFDEASNKLLIFHQDRRIAKFRLIV